MLSPLAVGKPGWVPKATRFTDVYVLPDGYTLEVHASHGNWQHFAAIEADEFDAEVVLVTLTLADNAPPQAGMTWHTMEGDPFRAEVRLQRPLGARVVVDASLATLEEARTRAVASAMAQRAEYELDADKPLVARLVDDLIAGRPGVLVHWTGHFPLFPLEHERLTAVAREVDRAREFAETWLLKQPREAFGGMMRTWGADDGQFTVLLTRPELVDELRRDATAERVPRLRVQLTARSEDELRRLTREVMDHLTHAGVDVRSTSIDTKHNRVRVRVSSEDDVDAVIARSTAMLAAITDPDAVHVTT